MSSSIRSDRALVAAAIALAIAAGAPSARADGPPDPALEALRESFREGMEKYRSGAYIEALRIWEEIYRKLGPEKGYLLAFNMARAREQVGDIERAGDHYEAYLDEVARRRASGDTLDPNVEKQEGEARARLEATRGQLEITPRADGTPVDVRLDDRTRPAGFFKYVVPNRLHVVVFAPGTRDETRTEVRVAIGERRTLTPPPARPVDVGPSARETPRSVLREERPYSATFVWVGAAATAVTITIPLALHFRALGIEEDYNAINTGANVPRAETLSRDYNAAKDLAYASFAVPAVFGAATLGLAAFWLWGGREVRVPVQASFGPNGACVAGRF